MYALLFPSAQSFISSVDENVNVDVRLMSGPTPTPTPCRFFSPACIASVWAPQPFVFFFMFFIVFFFALFCEAECFMVPPFWNPLSPQQAPIWRRPMWHSHSWLCSDARPPWPIKLESSWRGHLSRRSLFPVGPAPLHYNERRRIARCKCPQPRKPFSFPRRFGSYGAFSGS